MDNIVELRHITKTFPGIIANDDVSIDIRKGEIYAILGENGAGKSTLMSVLFGLYEPDSGEIIVRGKGEKIKTPLDANRLNIGMVHQHFKLVENQSAAENIILGIEPRKKRFLRPSRVNIEEANKRVKDLTKKYGLNIEPTEKVGKMPVSSKQRVEILKMLYTDSEILIFDEPTAVLTPQEIQSLLEIILNLKEQGKTIILITHKLDEIKKVADRCAILCKGKLVSILDVKDTPTKQMAALMVGREVSMGVEKTPFIPGNEILSVEKMSVANADKKLVVDNVSFKIHSGEILAVAGVAGNGQVAIADTLAGLTDMISGKILYQGDQIDSLSIRERSELGISYIPEDRHNTGLLLDCTLEENLCMKSYYQEPYCSPAGILNYDEFTKKAVSLIDAYDIRSGEAESTIVRSMSGGNQQKAIVAREIDLGKDLVIFVQPTRGLDIGAIENIHTKIVQLRDAGKAILLISLELDEVMALADTIMVVYNGKIQAMERADSFSKNQIGEYMMGVHHHE